MSWWNIDTDIWPGPRVEPLLKVITPLVPYSLTYRGSGGQSTSLITVSKENFAELSIGEIVAISPMVDTPAAVVLELDKMIDPYMHRVRVVFNS